MQKTEYQLPNGLKMSCRTSGQPDRPVLMFLHGFPEAAFAWDQLLEHFSQPENGSYFCVAPNMRGYADTDAPAETSQYRTKFLVQDIVELKQLVAPDQPLQALIAHDWGGAVAWSVANQHPRLMQRLVIINSPHPGTFLRELKSNPSQQASSAYMNFLIRSDAAKLLAEDDFRRLWEFFSRMQADKGEFAWLTEELRQQYRKVWSQGLEGGLNYYRASPLRPATASDPGANNINLPDEMLRIDVPTLVIWGMKDLALPPGLIDGLDQFVPDLTLHTLAEGTHWVIHEQPGKIIELIQQYLSEH
jgi:pimeloyl-ACP methyl ester carboxylesterase